MWVGAIHWNGVRSSACGAAREDVHAIGFNEGPDFSGSYEYFRGHGTEVIGGVRRVEPRAVLAEYTDRGGCIHSNE